MDSPGTRPDDGHGPHAADILLAAAARGFGSRARLRRIAVAMWCSFLGAILVLAQLLAVTPDHLDLGETSLIFLTSWAVTLVPVSLALSLCGPHDGR